MEKIVAQGLLYDFYGALLTRHQQAVYERVVYEDMSLTEIADATGVSKQAVHDLIRRTTAQMEEYEDKLHMIRRYTRLRDDAQRLTDGAAALEGALAGREDESGCREFCRKVREIADEIREDLK